MATSIVILETRIENNPDTFLPEFRGVTLWVSDGVTNYIAVRGNLPLAGDLLPGLLAISAQIWTDAVAAGQLATAGQTALADFIQWQLDNPGAKAIFTLTKAALEAEINSTVDIIFAGQTAANRTKVKRLWMCGALLDRIQTAES